MSYQKLSLFYKSNIKKVHNNNEYRYLIKTCIFMVIESRKKIKVGRNWNAIHIIIK